MNLKSEQLLPNLSVTLDYDEALSKKEIRETIQHNLGNNNCKIITLFDKNVLCYENAKGRKIILLTAAVTYLGGNGQHPVFKKRIQLPTWYKFFCEKCEKTQYDVKFIGVYHYKGLKIFVDFKKESYLNRKMNNSAAHVYINDLFQGIRNGVFTKIDRNENTIVTISYNSFKNYLDENVDLENNLFELFRKFNNGFSFGEWITAISVIQELYQKHWSQWRQTEWAGWFLEYKFNEFVVGNHLEDKMKYVGNLNKSKKKDLLDFDIWFEEQNFYGDLKASDIKNKVTPGNDQASFMECINRFDKFWYVIYEHDTIKDSDTNTDYEATRFRNNYIREKDNVISEDFDELSYHSRMKNRVKFKKMYIIELNRINYHEALTDFNQGHQPDGKARNPKFLINKRNIDNFVVFRYEC